MVTTADVHQHVDGTAGGGRGALPHPQQGQVSRSALLIDHLDDLMIICSSQRGQVSRVLPPICEGECSCYRSDEPQLGAPF